MKLGTGSSSSAFQTQIFVTVSVFLTVCSIFIVHCEDIPETHPCFRDCSSNLAKRMTCGYNFTLDYYWAMSKACYSCPNVTSDCSRHDCIPADGVKRTIAVVNRLMPGPPIRVCEGDTIVVDVKNNLFGEGTAIHWHGIHQKNTPWMDGVPGVTQCHIQPGTTFRYEFEAPLAGTHFWHSHAGFQRGDGIFGSLIVRKSAKADMLSRLYDYDLPEHEILIWDWLADMSIPVFLNHHHDDGDNKPRGVLINGKGLPPGFFNDFEDNETLSSKEKAFVPLHETRVRQGKAYRLRIISNGVLNCPLEFSIENHTMQVIASDGVDLDPVIVNSIVIYAGERWDIILRADQPVGSYWMKFRGLMDCDDRFTSAFQVSVLNYEGIPMGQYPHHSIKSWIEAKASEGLQLNPLNMNGGVEGQYMSVAELSSLRDDDPEIIKQEKADHQIYLSYDFNSVDNFRFHGPHIKIKSVRKGHKLYTPQINHISHVMPQSPPLIQPESLQMDRICNQESLKVNCTVEYCECIHLIKVELYSIVELVLVDRGYTFDANHPFHIHGHLFRVVGMERLGNNTEPHYIQNLDQKGLISRRTHQAVIKDSITVPDGGYTIVRFRADNPGFWFFHCHITFHVEVGMGFILQVGNLTDMPKPPENFPKCGDYLPPVDTSKGPLRVSEPRKPIVPLKNETNSNDPPYEMLTSTTEKSKHKDKPVKDKVKGESTSLKSSSILIFNSIILIFVTLKILR